MQITFTATGTVRQSVKMIDKTITAERLQEMLRSGTALTTIQEGGSVDITADGRKIAEVNDVYNELEYADFDVEEEEADTEEREEREGG